MVQSTPLAPQEREPGSRRGPGRPRQTETEPRAFAAALELFGQKGWAGLTLDGVASQAGIGKSSIYLRWDGKRELLLAAIRDIGTRIAPPEADHLPIRDHLAIHAAHRAELLRGEHGLALIALYSAVASDPECFGEMCAEPIAQGLRACRSRVDRAIAEGELRSGTDGELLLDALDGAVLVDAVLSRRRDDPRPLAEHMSGLVDQHLGGVLP